MFKEAIAVWIKGESETKNSQLVLKGEIDHLRGCQLRIAASSFYRLSVNGIFVAFGPARTAGGYARVDCIDLEKYDCDTEKNEIVIEIAGYYCRSLSTVLQKNFVTIEIVREGKVLWYTGKKGEQNHAVEAYRSVRRVQRAERYSMQRHFGEIWDEREGNPYQDKYKVNLVPVENQVKYISRGVPEPDYHIYSLDECVGTGVFWFDETLPYHKNRYTVPVERLWDKFEEEEICCFPFRWLQRHQLQRRKNHVKLPVELKENEYALFDFRFIQAGFLEWIAEASEESELVIGFSEMCFEKEFEFTNINHQNVIQVALPAGAKKEGYSFEPYTFRFCVLMVKKGNVKINKFGMRNFARDTSDMQQHEIRIPELRVIYDAAVRTFAHNAVDLFTDCPSRERGGWLCDSFFTGKAEYFLFGKTPIEDAFLENYRLYRNKGEYPEGILPMVYPSDRQEIINDFIPQWNLWYVIEVSEYLTQRNIAVDRDLFQESVFGVLRFFASYENADGLLQRLPSWNFIEWSTANKWGWDINYPTNFLYAQALQAAGELYGLQELCVKADRIRGLTRERAFDGEYFVDHAVLDEQGMWKNLSDTSEAGQYYAIMFGAVDMDDPGYRLLKENVLTGFKQRRDDGRVFVPVNAFIGFYLRICVLMQMGEKRILKQDIVSFFGDMVHSTGTLWEYKENIGSFDHGFASFAALAAVYADED